MHEWMNEWMNGWMDACMYEWMNEGGSGFARGWLTRAFTVGAFMIPHTCNSAQTQITLCYSGRHVYKKGATVTNFYSIVAEITNLIDVTEAKQTRNNPIFSSRMAIAYPAWGRCSTRSKRRCIIRYGGPSTSSKANPCSSCRHVFITNWCGPV